MTLAEGVPPNDVAAVTDLGDSTYQHDDHHRDLAAVCDAYVEFLADSQTPYFISADNSNETFYPNGYATADLWIASADKLDGGGPYPSSPLPALAAPYVGPGTVVDPIGYDSANPFYTGPGAFKTLKTGVIALQWFCQFELPGTGAQETTCGFDIYCENGSQQQQRIGNAIGAHGMTGPNAQSVIRSFYSGVQFLTVLDFDLLDEDPYSFPSYPAFSNLYAMQAGVVPLGWDIWPTIGLQHTTATVENFQLDHFGCQITKIA